MISSGRPKIAIAQRDISRELGREAVNSKEKMRVVEHAHATTGDKATITIKAHGRASLQTAPFVCDITDMTSRWKTQARSERVLGARPRAARPARRRSTRGTGCVAPRCTCETDVAQNEHI